MSEPRRLKPEGIRGAWTGLQFADWVSRSRARAGPLLASLDRRAFRSVVPAIAAATLWPFLLPLAPMEIKEPLFSDTIIYEYTAWCIRHGLKLYRDVGMMDGPFIHFLLAGMQAVVGILDREFRKGDLVLHASLSAAIGALLAPAGNPTRRGRIAARVSWAALASTLWMAWYSTLTWDVTTEREVYYSLFGSLAMVLLYASRNYPKKGALIAIFLGAFLAMTQAFGKPTGVMYPGIGTLCVLLQDAKATTTLRERCQAFAAGAAACVLVTILAVAVWGSFSGYWLWCVEIPFVQNRFLWRGDPLRIWLAGFDATRQTALISLVAGIAGIVCGLLPARALPFALVPLVAFAGFCLQGRGLVYQQVPVEAAGLTLALVFMSSLWPRYGSTAWVSWRGLLAMAFMTGFVHHAFEDIEASPYRWSGDEHQWKAAPANHPALDTDREAGLYVKAHTRPTDTGFVCCGYSLILLFAERRTASPFFHGVWLDSVDLALRNDVQPNAEQLAALRRLQTRIREMTCSAVERNKPAFMVFSVGGPLPQGPNLEQVYGICPNLRAMLAADYEVAKTIGDYQISIRKGAT